MATPITITTSTATIVSLTEVFEEDDVPISTATIVSLTEVFEEDDVPIAAGLATCCVTASVFEILKIITDTVYRTLKTTYPL